MSQIGDALITTRDTAGHLCLPFSPFSLFVIVLLPAVLPVVRNWRSRDAVRPGRDWRELRFGAGRNVSFELSFLPREIPPISGVFV